METIRPTVVNPSTANKLDAYAKLSKALVISPIANPRHILPLGVAFLAGVQMAEAAIVYSGTQNVSCALAGATARCYANINLAGGNDFEFHRNHVAAQVFIQVDEVFGGGFSLNGFHAQVAGGYVYPYANSAGVVIGPAVNWGFQAGQANSLSDNGFYPNHKWESLPNGTTRFMGIRGTIGSNTHYGWMRLTKNSFGNYTIVDWAYDNTPNTPITTGVTVPIELTSFDYRLNANDVQLNWRTATENNNAGFELQRSEDGNNFKPIAWIDGHGTTSKANNYGYDDKNLREGQTYYYRLRQVDNSGEFEFSPMVVVTIFGRGPVAGEFYPNPATAGEVLMDFAAQQAGDWNVIAYDAAGKEVHRQKLAVEEGLNYLSLNFAGLNSGMYFVKLENGGEKVYRKLTIK